MPDLTITQLPPLAGSALQSGDPIPLTDVSASETKKITTKDLIQYGIQLIDDNSIPSSKFEYVIAPGSIDTAELADGAVTAAKLADNSSGIVVAALPATGERVGQVAVVTTDNKIFVWSGSQWIDAKASGSVNTVIGDTTTLVPIGVLTNGDEVTLSAGLANTAGARQFLAGPTGNAGAVTQRQILGLDLPLATTATQGAVIPDGASITISAGGSLSIDNTVLAQGARALATWNEYGLITGGSPLISSDLPIASAGNPGAIYPGPEFTVDPFGELALANNATSGTFTKVQVDSSGLVVVGSQLEAADVPALDASKIATGAFPTDRLADDAVTMAKLANYAVSYIQEVQPSVVDPDLAIGCYWYQPSTGQLRIYDGNYFAPVGFGRLSQENLRWGGTISAATGLVTGVTSLGTEGGLVIGQQLPTATDALGGLYALVDTPGTNINVTPGVTYDAGDWCLCINAAEGWVRIDTLSGGGGGGSTTLASLLDVTITNPTNGQALIFNSATSQWINGNISGDQDLQSVLTEGNTATLGATFGGTLTTALCDLNGIAVNSYGDMLFADNKVLNFGTGAAGRISYLTSTSSFDIRVPGGTDALKLGSGNSIRFTSADGLTEYGRIDSSTGDFLLGGPLPASPQTKISPNGAFYAGPAVQGSDPYSYLSTAGLFAKAPATDTDACSVELGCYNGSPGPNTNYDTNIKIKSDGTGTVTGDWDFCEGLNTSSNNDDPNFNNRTSIIGSEIYILDRMPYGHGTPTADIIKYENDNNGTVDVRFSVSRAGKLLVKDYDLDSLPALP